MNIRSVVYRSLAALWLTWVLLGSFLANAQLSIPGLTGHVIDQTHTLTPEQKTSLEQTLTAFETRKGSQIAVLMVASTKPEEIEQYALRVAEVWKLGRQKIDDGVILVVAKNDRTLRIEVGYGLEGAVNDLTSKRIINETIVPRFKQQDYYGGIDAGVAKIIRTIDGEPLPEPASSPAESYEEFLQFAPFLFIMALAVGGVLRNSLGKVPGSLITGGVVALFAWFAMDAVLISLFAGLFAMVMTLMRGVFMRQGFGGYFDHGGGGFGGSGGSGGFRGGGGGFGGGGASGRW